jgi:TPR repeat protein
MKNIKHWLSPLAHNDTKIPEDVFRQVTEEVEAKKVNSTLIAQAIAQAGDDKTQVKSLYIELRAKNILEQRLAEKKPLKTIVLVGVAVVLIIGGVGFAIWQNNQTKPVENTVTPENVAKTQAPDPQKTSIETFNQAMQLYRQKNYTETFQLLQQLAEQGNAPAQFNLAQMYRNGQGVAADDAQAMVWYRKAADQGQVEAQSYLGWMYSKAQDYSPAVEWYRKAAEQGYAEAQYNLGWLYTRGRGVAQDDKKAFEWFTKAAQQAYVDAQFNVGWMYAKGLGVAQDEKQAVDWFQKAAQQGYADAEFNLGLMYAKGLGVAKEDKQAIGWFQKAAQHGQKDALALLKRAQ